MTRERIGAVAAVAMRWNYRVWGFGEAIALRGLLAAGDALGDAAPFGFVHAIMRSWLGRGVARSNEDHVGAGRELIELHRRTGDAQFLEAARRLATLNAGFPAGANGERYHLRSADIGLAARDANIELDHHFYGKKNLNAT